MENIAIVIFVVGILIAAGLSSKLILPRLSIHPLIGYILTGLLFRCLDGHEHFLLDHVMAPLMFLAEIGVIILLFHAGLESNITSLLQQLPRAVWIWFWDVVVSGIFAFVTTYYLLGFTVISSLFTATALTATSIAVSVAIWESTGISQTEQGQLLLDLAELDDLSSIGLLALLLALVPVLGSATEMVSATLIAKTVGMFLPAFILFAIGCSLFSWKIEPLLSHWVTQRQTNHDHMLMIIAIGLMIAALAEWLGLSLAIGAFFGGLAFSRDPETARERMCFKPLYDFFTPFFFIGIGLQIDPTAFTSALWPGLLLLTAAVVGKVIGAGAPVVTSTGLTGAAVIGVSMIPRAEVSMIVMEKGFDLGHHIVPQGLFSAVVIVVAGTTLLTPAVLPMFVRSWTQRNEKDKTSL